MDMKFGKSRTSGKKYFSKIAWLSLVGGAALAAAVFAANGQPWGYVAPPALSSINFKDGDAVAYTPWFEQGTFRGDLLALPVASDGTVLYLTPKWRAADELDDLVKVSHLGRRIVTTEGGAILKAKPFQIDSLTDGQVAMLGSGAYAAKDVLEYVRGERDKESESGMRIRSSVLGDIVHSGPAYVGKPGAGYTFDKYPAFALAKAGRDGRVYVGANDGMLHAFDAISGEEVFAYIPSMVIGNLRKLPVQPYSHQYFVDGFLTVEDAQINSAWHTLLVGGLGAGGKGYYGLDVTSSAKPLTESQAADKILWEFHTASTGAENLGYSYSRASIVRLDDKGSWGAVVGNGYLSTTGVASLYVINVGTGAVIKELVVADADNNGLSSPAVVDSDGDGIVDTAYAGDLNGNLWKFNLGPDGPSSWGVALGGEPLFKTAAGQSITTAPEVGRHPKEGVMVYVGTGKLLSAADGDDKTTQAVYGIWDNGEQVTSSQLLRQQLKSAVHASSVATRVVTNNKPDWSTHRGWMTPTEIAGASALDQGERVLQDLLLRDGRVSLMSINPTINTGDNWFVQLDAITGGAPGATIIDVNEDSLLDLTDNVDGDGDGEVGDIPADRVVGQYQKFGLASRPVIGILSGSSDAALINHLAAISPNNIFSYNDPGLLGGHFDLDTSSMLYDFSAGDTDGHVHEWDDKWNKTTVDYMDLPDVDKDGSPKLFEINADKYGDNDAMGDDAIFMITVANTDLSPGGEIEINSIGLGVTEYRELTDRFLSGKLRGSDAFPLYKLTEPTDSEKAAGVVRLHTLKMSFDAFAIVSGDLIPTKTGCVRGNDPGGRGEYRNGALLVQAADASNLVGGFSFDKDTGEYVANSAAFNKQHGHATEGLFWESSLFWHWDGACYGEAEWEPEYKACIRDGGGQCLADVSADQKEKGKKKKKKKKNDPDPPVIVDPPEEEDTGPVSTGETTDPGHNVTNTTIKGSSDTGRLFWTEFIPQE